MDPPQRPPPLGKPRSGNTAVLLSAAVYPGAGQIVQRRWGAAILVGTTFTAVAVWFVVEAVQILRVYYGLAFRFNEAQADPPGFGRMLLSFAVCMVVYLAGLIDTVQANHRLTGPGAVR